MASYIDEKLKPKFESLPIELKNEILKRNINLHSFNDLIKCLEQIVDEG